MSTGHSIFQFDAPDQRREDARAVLDHEHRVAMAARRHQGRVFPAQHYTENLTHTFIPPASNDDLSPGVTFYSIEPEVSIKDVPVYQGRQVGLFISYKVVAGTVNNPCPGAGNGWPMGIRVGVRTLSKSCVECGMVGAYGQTEGIGGSNGEPGVFWQPGIDTTGRYRSISSDFTDAGSTRNVTRGGIAHFDPIPSTAQLTPGKLEFWTFRFIYGFGTNGLINTDVKCDASEGLLRFNEVRMWVFVL